MIINKLCFIFGVIALLGAAVFAGTDDENQTSQVDDGDRNSVVPTSQSSDITIPQGLLAMLANGGAVAAGILAVAALAVVIMPLLGVRICTVLGNCDSPTYQAYSANPNSVYDYQGYSQTGTYNNPTYQKRSIEYIGPILKALGNAYDKYHRQTAASAMKSSK